MSFSELLTIGIVMTFLLKPEDIPIIIKKFKKLKSFFSNGKDKIYQQISENLEIKISNPSAENKNITNELTKINYYLNKLAEMDIIYDDEYDLEKVKEFYHKKTQDRIEEKKKSS